MVSSSSAKCESAFQLRKAIMDMARACKSPEVQLKRRAVGGSLEECAGLMGNACS